jgi:GMP synthase (glutamine-hydrolysing)
MIEVVQNDPEVPPGLLMDLLREKRVRFRLIRLFAGEGLENLDQLQGVIVLGGIMSVRDIDEFPFLQRLEEQIREVVSMEIPFLGICLGGQLLAEVLGGKVSFKKHGELGCHRLMLTDGGERDPLFAGVPKHFLSFQWHNDSFEPPPGALHLARSDTCPYQAFRCGRTAYGIQFHPEVTREIVREWSSDLGEQQQELLHAFADREAEYRLVSMCILNNFLRVAGMF